MFISFVMLCSDVTSKHAVQAVFGLVPKVVAPGLISMWGPPNWDSANFVFSFHGGPTLAQIG